MKRVLPTACLAACAAVALTVSGCAGAGNPRAIAAGEVPLPPGTHVTTSARSCDRGAHAFCSVQLVVVGNASQYPTSADLFNAENHDLMKLGWTVTRGATGKQLAAESPGHELRLDYDTAYNDLLALDSSWIERRPVIGRALSAAIFDRASAISLMLERASS